MQIRYSLTAKEVATVMRARAHLPRLMAFSGVSFGGLMGLFAAADDLSWGDPILWEEVLIQGVVTGLLFAAVMGVVFGLFFIPWQAGRFVGENPLNFNDIVATIGEDGVSFETPKMSNRYEWSDLRGYREIKGGFLISPSKTISHYVPKSAITPDEAEQLRSIVRSRLSDR